MARILFTWELGAASGHWANVRPVAEKLSEAGHEIYAALRNVDVVGNRRNTQYSLKLVQAPYLTTPQSEVVPDVRSLAHLLHNVGYYDSLPLLALVEAWRNLYRFVQPDLICFEHSPTALLAASGLNCRRVVMGTGFCSPPAGKAFPDLQPWKPAMSEELLETESTIRDRINDVRQAIDSPPVNQSSEIYSDVDESFLLTFAELDHCGPRDDVEYWGTWPSTASKSPVWQSESDRAKIFAYLPMEAGRTFVLEGLSKTEHDVVAYLPHCGREITKRYASSQMRIVSEPVNLDAVAQGCSLAILNAGANTVANLLLRGVPSLNVVQSVEQVLMGYRLTQARLGAACHVSQPEMFQPALEMMLSETRFADSARAFAAKYQSFDPHAKLDVILDRIAQLL